MFRLLLKRMNAIPTPTLVKVCFGVLITDISLTVVDHAFGEDLVDYAFGDDWINTKQRQNALKDISGFRDRR